MRIRNISLRDRLTGAVLCGVLGAVPFVGAGGIDNDSPFNLPAFATDSENETHSVADGRGRLDPSKVAILVPDLGIGATLNFVEKIGLASHAELRDAKFAAIGTGSGAVGDKPRFFVPDGAKVTAVDSQPGTGDTDVEVKGRFAISHGVGVMLKPAFAPGLMQAFLVIGEPAPGVATSAIPSVVEAVVPIAGAADGIDVGAIATGLVGIPGMAGKQATVVLLRINALTNGSPNVKVEAGAGFVVGTGLTIVDTVAYSLK